MHSVSAFCEIGNLILLLIFLWFVIYIGYLILLLFMISHYICLFWHYCCPVICHILVIWYYCCLVIGETVSLWYFWGNKKSGMGNYFSFSGAGENWLRMAKYEFASIGRFSEAGLHEWMPFVIFCTRSCERLQCHFRANFWVGVASCCV